MNQPRLFAAPQEATTSDDYDTPKWIFDALGIVFDLDVACPPYGPLFTPCKAHYTQEDDGLASDWHGVVWMNPPYSHSTVWVNKFMKHKNGICLVPFAKSAWANKLWDDADAITMMPSNTKFVQGTIFLQTMLAAYGNNNVQAISNIGRVR